jgi:hypothetical protein
VRDGFSFSSLSSLPAKLASAFQRDRSRLGFGSRFLRTFSPEYVYHLTLISLYFVQVFSCDAFTRHLRFNRQHRPALRQRFFFPAKVSQTEAVPVACGVAGDLFWVARIRQTAVSCLSCICFNLYSAILQQLRYLAQCLDYRTHIQKPLNCFPEPGPRVKVSLDNSSPFLVRLQSILQILR